jgi:hypothetical protein
MPFPHKGENHYSGILNEKQLTVFLDEKSSIIGPHIKNKYTLTDDSIDIHFKHQGGTKCVDDANILKAEEKISGVSYKNHKTGTFDWLNTTKNIPQDSILKEKLAAFKLVSNIKTKEEFDQRETQLRIDRDTIMNEYIKNFTSDMLKNVLHRIYDEYSDHIVITLCTKQKYLYYPKNEENFKEFIGYNDWTYYVKDTRAKTSAQIWRSNNETDEDVYTGLRIRLTLNNGLNAFFGLSSSNKNSYPCIKIQQEKIDDVFIPSLIDTIEEGFIVEEKTQIEENNLS